MLERGEALSFGPPILAGDSRSAANMIEDVAKEQRIRIEHTAFFRKLFILNLIPPYHFKLRNLYITISRVV